MYVSVIIPCFNSEMTISNTLNSCINQIKYIKEIIVVDDQSTDETRNIVLSFINKYPNLIVYIFNRNKGGNNARNLGFAHSSGSFIQWLDSDDLLIDGKFKEQIKCFDDKIDIVYSDWYQDNLINGRLISREEKKKGIYNDMIYELLIDNWSPPVNYLIKREFAEKLHVINAWNPNTIVFQDREYFTIASILGAKFKYCMGYYSIYNVWNINSVSKSKNKQLSLTLILDRFEQLLKEYNPKNAYFDVLDTQRLIIEIGGIEVNYSSKMYLKRIVFFQNFGMRTMFKMIWTVFMKK